MDRNHFTWTKCYQATQSPSSRRAWIEIRISSVVALLSTVALLAEGVDRNLLSYSLYRPGTLVALLAEGVDRNHVIMKKRWKLKTVALLAEGVDRNIHHMVNTSVRKPSPSSRRAWIEMLASCFALIPLTVALLAEGVDRNKAREFACKDGSRRPPRGGRG